jgi:CrcB protein
MSRSKNSLAKADEEPVVLRDFVWLALAGATGTLLRYGLSGVTQRICGEKFPWGTLAVNALGCFLFGLVWTLAEDRMLISGRTRFLVLTGFMGAFTTFSTFAFETSQLLDDAQWGLALGNLAGQVVLGLIGVFLGLAAGRLL